MHRPDEPATRRLSGNWHPHVRHTRAPTRPSQGFRPWSCPWPGCDYMSQPVASVTDRILSLKRLGAHTSHHLRTHIAQPLNFLRDIKGRAAIRAKIGLFETIAAGSGWGYCVTCRLSRKPSRGSQPEDSVKRTMKIDFETGQSCRLSESLATIFEVAEASMHRGGILNTKRTPANVTGSCPPQSFGPGTGTPPSLKWPLQA